MDERPLTKPDHLRDAPRSTSAYLAARPAGLAALVLGVIAFAVAAVTQQGVWSTPDWRISMPGFALTLIAGIVSLSRKESAHALWIAGVTLAGVAVVLGWFLMVAIVIAVAAVLILILHSVM